MESGSSTGEGAAGGRGSDGAGMGMGTLGFSVEEVGRGGRESTVDVRSGTSPTSFRMVCGF